MLHVTREDRAVSGGASSARRRGVQTRQRRSRSIPLLPCHSKLSSNIIVICPMLLCHIRRFISIVLGHCRLLLFPRDRSHTMIILCKMFVFHVCLHRNRVFSLRLVLILFFVVALLLLCCPPRESSCFMSLALVRLVRFLSSCPRRNLSRILNLFAYRRPRLLARDSCLGAATWVLSSSPLMTPLVRFFVRFV